MKNPPILSLVATASFGVGLGFGSVCGGKPFEMVAETPIGIIRFHVNPTNSHIPPFIKDMQDVTDNSIKLA